MEIAVCIKQVPDTPNIRIDRERMTIIREGTESIINPADCIALEAALRLRDKRGGKITVLTMGPPQSEAALREALAYGADRALLITDPAFAGADTLATSLVLAKAIARLDPFPELILCGKQTIDSDTGHVGPQIAEELNLPQVCGVHEIHVEEKALVVKRRNDGFLDTLRIALPGVITISRDFCIHHHICLGDLETAFTTGEVTQWDLKVLGLNPQEVGFEGSATWVVGLHKPPPKRKGEMVSGTPRELVDQMIDRLENLSILDEESRNE
jgi:electron transfer flavoprotein beta subunit